MNYDSSERKDALPGFLVERKIATPAQAERVVEALGSGLRIGAALADAGVEAAGEELLQILRDYTRDRLAQLIGMREGRFAFYGGDEFQREVATVEIPALAPVLEGARRAMPLKALATPLRKHLDEYPVRSPDFGKDLPAMGLDTEDLKIAMQVNGRLLLRDILAHGRGELRLSFSLMWFLRLAGGVTFSPTPVAMEGAELSGGSGRHCPAQAQAVARGDDDGAARGGAEDPHQQLLPEPGAGHLRGHGGGRARLPRDGDEVSSRTCTPSTTSRT